MSRFLVLVIGEHPESQLSQYSSFESGQYRNKYLQIEDETEKAKSEYDPDVHASLNEHMIEYCENLWAKKLNTSDAPDFNSLHRSGYYTLDDKGNVNKIMHRHNPKSQCIHFELGGGWAGYFYVKPKFEGIETGKNRRGTPVPRPRTSDRLLKSSIDFERMKKEGRSLSVTLYDTYVLLKDKHSGTDSQDFKKEFIDFLTKENCNPFFNDDDYNVSKSEFVRRGELRNISAFAFLKDGIWHELEFPNWIAGATLPLSELEWLEKTWTILDALPDNTQFSMFECFC